MATVAMSIEQKKAAIHHIFEEVNKKHLAVFDKTYSPKVVLHQTAGTEVKGLEAFKQIWAEGFAAFPDFHFTLEDIVVEGDKAAFRYTQTGTFKNEMTIQGKKVAPNGKKVTSTRFVFTRSEGEKVVEVWVMQDRLSSYQQMGILPAAK